MKILIWTQYFWPERFHINEVSLALVALGHEVTILTGKPNYPSGRLFPGYQGWGCQKETHQGLHICRIPLLPRGKGGALGLIANYLSFIASGYLLAPRVLRGKDYDVVFVFAPSPLLQALPAIRFARRNHIPLTLWVQDLWPEALAATGFVKNRSILRLVEFLVRYIYRSSDMILVQSEAFRPSVERLSGGKSAIRFHPNSIMDFAGFCTPSAPAAELCNRIRKSFSVVFTGNIGHAQATETIIDAAERLKSFPDIRFYIVGDGSRASWMKEEITRRGLDNIFMTGPFGRSDMPAVMQAASVLLLTLGSGAVGAQTVPSKLQAYFSAGKPVVASVDGETARILKEAAAGIACRADDGAALAEAIAQIYRLPDAERQELGENGSRYFAAHFSPGRLTGQLVEYLKQSKVLKRSAGK